MPEPGKPGLHADVLFGCTSLLDGCDCASRAAPGCIERALNGLVIHREKLDEQTLNALTDCCPAQALTVCGEERQVEEISGDRPAR